MGGSLDVTATSDGPGKGSEFVLRLPAAEGQTGAEFKVNGEPTASKLRHCRVLVVDDNADTANGMARLLKLSGHEVRVAHNAKDALDVARVFRPEVMVLDMGLPGMDGCELASTLRQE